MGSFIQQLDGVWNCGHCC